MTWLVPAFLLTALLYASIGFGGGSTYTALLALAELSYGLIPPVSLTCNLVVVSGSTLRFHRAQLINWKECGSYLLLSIPAAWFAGTLSLPRELFFGILGSALGLSAVAMWVRSRGVEVQYARPPFALRVALGAAFGLLAGLVGIGGGIFLSPCLHLLHAASPKRIAAISSVYIAANSLAGLLGHTMRLGDLSFLSNHAWLFAAVLIGGQLGNWLSLRVLSERTIRTLTSVLVLYVGVRLLIVATT